LRGCFTCPAFIYNTEAAEKSQPEKNILQDNWVMMRRLWFGITWPSAILTLIFGPWWYLMGDFPQWLMIKLCFVIGLYVYHFTLHAIYKQQVQGIFNYSSQQLRVWNEVAAIFLVVIVMLAVVKQNISAAWGIVGLIAFVILLMSAIRVYKLIRKKVDKSKDG
jgi:putative membrane protein